MRIGTARGDARRRLLLPRTALSSLLALFATSQVACDYFSSTPPGANGAPAPSVSSQAGGGGAGGSTTITITLPMIAPPCVPPIAESAVFAASMIADGAPARRELYTWTTAEQAQQIRASSVLLTRSERPGLGPGYAIDVLTRTAGRQPTSSTEADQIALAKLLIGERFEKARYAWTEPWATRVGWPGETYGDQLVRIMLRPEAWLARLRYGQVDVLDMNNQPVGMAEALAHPERIAGFYFMNDGEAGGPHCSGSFRSGGDGYREFVVSNEAMVEEWSIGTSEIRARLEADLARLEEFLKRIRSCPVQTDAAIWNTNVVCDWPVLPVSFTEISAYEHALAIPSPGYMPSPAAIAGLIDTLQASLFEPDPFVFKPNP